MVEEFIKISLQMLISEFFQVKYRRNECVKALDFLEKLNEGRTSGNVLKTSFDLNSFEVSFIYQGLN